MQLGKPQLGDPVAFTGNGYMLLGLEVDASRIGIGTTPLPAAVP